MKTGEPIAVIDFDIDQPVMDLSAFRNYGSALFLVRYKGLPVGRYYGKLVNGHPVAADFLKELSDACGLPLWNEWAAHRLGLKSSPELPGFLPAATVAVCTRNRTSDLQHCLNALMALPDDGQEFLVIDNCPSDESTASLVSTYSRVRYVRENRPGLNIARNRALMEASFPLVVFTDDDAVPDRQWLRSLVRNFSDSRVACVTGLTMPLELETDAQIAFEMYSSFSKGFNRIVHSMDNRNPLATGNVGAGANMAIRKSITDEIGFFDEALDAGTITKSGGDHEYFSRILTSGRHIVYEPNALSWHRHRRTWKETKDAIYGYGVGVYAFWTRALLVERETTILKLPVFWFIKVQFRNIVKRMVGIKSAPPLDLIMAELSGCIVGPWAYLRSRANVKSTKLRSNA